MLGKDDQRMHPMLLACYSSSSSPSASSYSSSSSPRTYSFLSLALLATAFAQSVAPAAASRAREEVLVHVHCHVLERSGAIRSGTPSPQYLCAPVHQHDHAVAFGSLSLFLSFSPVINLLIPHFCSWVPQRYNFAIYVGTQVDPNWDDLQRRQAVLRSCIFLLLVRSTDGLQELVRELTTLLTPLNITLKVFRYSLNPGVRDITWKYNQLILQAHADGYSEWSCEARSVYD